MPSNPTSTFEQALTVLGIFKILNAVATDGDPMQFTEMDFMLIVSVFVGSAIAARSDRETVFMCLMLFAVGVALTHEHRDKRRRVEADVAEAARVARTHPTPRAQPPSAFRPFDA